MNLEAYRIARQNLRANRTRTMLTTLGIIIGVASITLVLSLGQGLRQAVGKQVQHLGNNVIVVKPGEPSSQTLGSLNPYGSSPTSSLTERDYTTAKTVGNVSSVSPVMLLRGSIKAQDQSAPNASILATSEPIVDTLGLKVRSGQFIDSQTARDTVVLGQSLAIKLFGTDEAMGQTVQLKGRTHTVIGVIRNTNTPVNLSGVDLDNAAYISLEDGKSYNQGLAQIQQLIVKVKDTSRLQSTVAVINAKILQNHDSEQDFEVLGGQAIADSSNSLFSSLVIVTTIVSIITLIVSGIGVMNIMLVSVTERTREVGIRKALGATDQNIMGQFVIEALLMCVSGGIIGVIVAYALAFIIGTQLAFQPSLNPLIIATGFGLALLVGVLFGIYPAVKAARKDPIEALRQYQ